MLRKVEGLSFQAEVLNFTSLTKKFIFLVNYVLFVQHFRLITFSILYVSNKIDMISDFVGQIISSWIILELARKEVPIIMSQLTPTEIVQWFREQAEIFTQMADTVENTFRAVPRTELTVQTTTTPHPNGNTATAEKIRQLVSVKAARAASLAKALGTSKAHIRRIVTAEGSGLVLGDRGWIFLTEQTAKE
jgi:hypothetical protein